VFHGALGYALELGLLPANPLNMVQWRAQSRGASSTAPTAPSAPSPPARPGRHAPPALGRIRTAADGRLFRGDRGGMLSESVYGRAWHAARRAALGPGPGRHRARPPPLQPAARRAVLAAERPQGIRRGRRPGRHQHTRPAGRLRPLHQRPARHCQPADRRRPRRRRQRDTVVTVRERERFCAPSAPPRTLSAMCTRTGPRSRA